MKNKGNAGKGRPPKITIATVRNGLVAGMTPKQIAAVANCTTGLVHRHKRMIYRLEPDFERLLAENRPAPPLPAAEVTANVTALAVESAGALVSGQRLKVTHVRLTDDERDEIETTRRDTALLIHDEARQVIRNALTDPDVRTRIVAATAVLRHLSVDEPKDASRELGDGPSPLDLLREHSRTADRKVDAKPAAVVDKPGSDSS